MENYLFTPFHIFEEKKNHIMAHKIMVSMKQSKKIILCIL